MGLRANGVHEKLVVRSPALIPAGCRDAHVRRAGDRIQWSKVHIEVALGDLAHALPNQVELGARAAHLERPSFSDAAEVRDFDRAGVLRSRLAHSGIDPVDPFHAIPALL